ncbi:type II toxin-antitoxin system prevent-host-death family antitoxin [Lysobacteraceae bacterium NML75-0749]|nr:type II toxin-antitoxin system prevent-host-death family antitoxin [Xanthomonadaceae bacterium NML03-0222]PJK02245.1 type II toxin-antitoxin system prevent-host-death family antitoxin [Xanthomonadaceae bacterium NML91-0268]PJK03522.1 type II toxin-antitoxin system prevent-host-death family antitoxin [Xanthomonadaceae bacterium NML75-0749]PJK04087.1 type II toxin-antitoxin system prevent-host-death family antitoxin [Xanthomonadaceae bacterium NML71-0210]
MKNVSVVEAKAHFSALLTEVEAGAQVAVTRHGKVVARLVPEQQPTALDALKHLWAGDRREMDLQEPDDLPPSPVAWLD